MAKECPLEAASADYEITHEIALVSIAISLKRIADALEEAVANAPRKPRE